MADMLDKLKQFLEIDGKNKIKLDIEISDKLPSVLYGDESGVIKTILYFFDLIVSISNKRSMSLVIDDIKVGRFSRLRFKFVTSDKSILDYLEEDKKTKKLKLTKTNDVNYEIIENLLEKMNGSITITKEDNTINLLMGINQRLMSEYDVINEKQENKNVKIKYHNYSNKRILIVDDNNLRLKEIKILLRPYNVEIVSVKNRRDMGNMLSANETFDMIIIDDIIPNFEIDSFTNEVIKNQNDILNYIKKQAKYNIITIIMVTPNNKNIEDKYIEYGFNDYIIKPINKENIDKILNKYFNEE